MQSIEQIAAQEVNDIFRELGIKQAIDKEAMSLFASLFALHEKIETQRTASDSRVAYEMLKIALSVGEAYALLDTPLGDKAKAKKNYYDLAMKNHPDKGGDEKIMKQLNEAYEIVQGKGKPSQPSQQERKEQQKKEWEERKKKDEEQKKEDQKIGKKLLKELESAVKGNKAKYLERVKKVTEPKGFNIKVSGPNPATMYGTYSNVVVSIPIEGGDISFKINLNNNHVRGTEYYVDTNAYINRKDVRFNRSKYTKYDSLSDAVSVDKLIPLKRLKAIWKKHGGAQAETRMKRKDFEKAIQKELDAVYMSKDTWKIPLGGERYFVIYRGTMMRTAFWAPNGVYEKYKKVDDIGFVTWPETPEGLMDIHKVVKKLR